MVQLPAGLFATSMMLDIDPSALYCMALALVGRLYDGQDLDRSNSLAASSQSTHTCRHP